MKHMETKKTVYVVGRYNENADPDFCYEYSSLADAETAFADAAADLKREIIEYLKTRDFRGHSGLRDRYITLTKSQETYIDGDLDDAEYHIIRHFGSADDWNEIRDAMED